MIVVKGKCREGGHAKIGLEIVKCGFVRDDDRLGVSGIGSVLTLGKPVDPLEWTMNTGRGDSCSGVKART